jgi:Phage capsid family
MKKDCFSLSRFIGSILTRGTPTGYELDISNELGRSLSPNWKSKRGEPTGFMIPSSAFETRDITTGGSGSYLVGKRVEQVPGILGWSAVLRSGANILRLRDSDCQIWLDTNLPTAQWLPEIGTITKSDPNLAGPVLTPRRICAQCVVARKLLIQATSTLPFDEFLGSRLKLICSSRLDQVALYGGNPHEPNGIVSTTGTNHYVVATPPATWTDLNQMRLLSTNLDIDRSSFSYITSPVGRKSFEATAKFASGAVTLWDAVGAETEISREVSDNRIFAGCFNYLTVALWSGTSEIDTAVDLTVDPFTLAHQAEVILTVSLFCDVGIHFPAAFTWTDANAVS